MVWDFVGGVLLLGSMLHLSFGIWEVPMISPFGSSARANVLYGSFALLVSLGLYGYRHGTEAIGGDGLLLGGLFAIG